MTFNKISIPTIIILCFCTIYILFNIKTNVMELRSDLILIKKQIHYEIDAIHILKAELAYLTSPSRLKKLNEQHLKLTETKSEQIIYDLQKETVIFKSHIFASTKNVSADIKWRYKKSHGQYLRLTSSKQ